MLLPKHTCCTLPTTSELSDCHWFAGLRHSPLPCSGRLHLPCNLYCLRTSLAVLAAFACWTRHNIKAMNEENTQRITTVCSRIRFPAISASTLQNYW